MSCDSCHLEGHDEGILFEKTHPLRIYRSPTVRGTRETPPYFTPASTFSLAETARIVGDRNRYMNPTLTESEVRQLTLFSATVTTLPNPYRGPDGAPPASLALPGGGTGRPPEGRRLFEGKADCVRLPSAAALHHRPGPLDPRSLHRRGHAAGVSSANRRSGNGVPWGGCALAGGRLGRLPDAHHRAGRVPRGGRPRGPLGPVPLRAMIDRYCAPPHGNAAALDAREKDDSLAYLLTL